MAKLIRCECGFVARGDSDDQVVGVLQGHISSDHPALLATVSQEDLLSWVQAELGERLHSPHVEVAEDRRAVA
jgi:hypothetical protein